MDFFETLWLFITTRWLLSAGIALLVLIALFVLYQFIDSLRWTHFKMNFPFFGTLAKENNLNSGAYPGFNTSEANICAKYAEHLRGCWGAENFKRYRDYINLAGDSKQKPTPLGMWIVLAVLVTAESLGFSYMLGKWMAMEASENTHVLLMFAIVTVICIVMVILTHEAGKEWYCTSRKINYYKGVKRESNKHNLFEQSVPLSENQDIDLKTKDGAESNPDYQRALNRIDDSQKTYFMRTVTVVAIIVIALTSTWMRYNAMEQDLINETTLQQESGNAADPFAMVLPDEITESQDAADKKAFDERQSATRQEGMAAFIMLAFIFVITQIVGIVAGLKSAFVGRESWSAYQEVRDFPDFISYKNRAPVIQKAQSSLNKWRSKQSKNAYTNLNFESSGSFIDYLDYDKGIKKVPPAVVKESAPAAQEVAPQIVAPAQESAPAPQLSAPTSTPQIVPTESAVPSFAEIKAHLESLNDKEKEMAYYQSLPAVVKTAELKAFLKDRKAARDAELDELF